MILNFTKAILITNFRGSWLYTPRRNEPFSIQERGDVNVRYTAGYNFRLKGRSIDRITASQARTSFYKLIDKTNMIYEPTIIKGKRNDTILLSREDWRCIQETLFLVSIPGVRQSIIEELQIPLEETSQDLEW